MRIQYILAVNELQSITLSSLLQTSHPQFDTKTIRASFSGKARVAPFFLLISCCRELLGHAVLL